MRLIIVKIDIDKLIECDLSFDEYFLLLYLYNEDMDSIFKYFVGDNKLDLLTFRKLVVNGWIEDSLTFNDELGNLKLTDKFAKEFMGIIINKNLNFDECFQQLREYYPIKAGNSERRLQGNIDKCKKLYQFTIMKNGKIDEQLHNIILQCINFEINLRTKNRSLEYFQLLATWLGQRTWELYKEDVQVLVKEIGWVDKNRSDEGNVDAI